MSHPRRTKRSTGPNPGAAKGRPASRGGRPARPAPSRLPRAEEGDNDPGSADAPALPAPARRARGPRPGRPAPPVGQRMANEILHAAREVIARGLGDPRLDGCLITLTAADLSPDGRNATLLASVLPEKAQSRAIAALSHAATHIRRKVGDVLNHAAVPQLTFRLDSTLKKQAAILTALARAASERPAPGPASPAQPPSTEPPPAQ